VKYNDEKKFSMTLGRFERELLCVFFSLISCSVSDACMTPNRFFLFPEGQEIIAMILP
jgi:hypothetical protein